MYTGYMTALFPQLSICIVGILYTVAVGLRIVYRISAWVDCIYCIQEKTHAPQLPLGMICILHTSPDQTEHRIQYPCMAAMRILHTGRLPNARRSTGGIRSASSAHHPHSIIGELRAEFAFLALCHAVYRLRHSACHSPAYIEAYLLYPVYIHNQHPPGRELSRQDLCGTSCIGEDFIALSG